MPHLFVQNNRKKLVKKKMRKEKERKNRKIGAHFSAEGEGRGNKSGSGARLNKKNSAGLISKERTGERRWTKCKLLHKPR